MKHALNVFSASAAALAMSAFLAACGSQDTMTGRQYTAAEVKQFCSQDPQHAQACVKANIKWEKGQTDVAGGSSNAGRAPSAPTVTTTAPGAITKNDSTQSNTQESKPGTAGVTNPSADPAKTPAQSAPQAAAVKPEAKKSPAPTIDPKSEEPNLFKSEGTGSASNKVFVEYAVQQDLITSNLAALANPNADVKKLVDGLSAHFYTGDDGKLYMSVEAAIWVEGMKRNLFIDHTPVEFNKDKNVHPVTIRVTDLTMTDVPADLDKVKASVVCANQNCESIQLRIDFLFENGAKTVPAVFAFFPASKYAMLQSNYGEKIPSYNDARDEKFNYKAPVVKNPVAKNQTTTTPGNHVAPATPAPAHKPSTSTPSAKTPESATPSSQKSAKPVTLPNAKGNQMLRMRTTQAKKAREAAAAQTKEEQAKKAAAQKKDATPVKKDGEHIKKALVPVKVEPKAAPVQNFHPISDGKTPSMTVAPKASSTLASIQGGANFANHPLHLNSEAPATAAAAPSKAMSANQLGITPVYSVSAQKAPSFGQMYPLISEAKPAAVQKPVTNAALKARGTEPTQARLSLHNPYLSRKTVATIERAEKDAAKAKDEAAVQVASEQKK